MEDRKAASSYSEASLGLSQLNIDSLRGTPVPGINEEKLFKKLKKTINNWRMTPQVLKKTITELILKNIDKENKNIKFKEIGK